MATSTIPCQTARTASFSIPNGKTLTLTFSAGDAGFILTDGASANAKGGMIVYNVSDGGSLSSKLIVNSTSNMTFGDNASARTITIANSTGYGARAFVTSFVGAIPSASVS